MRTGNNVLSIGIILLATIACTDRAVFDDVYTFGDEGWQANDPLIFQATIADTSQAYDMLFHIRNERNYAYSNIWLFIETTAPNGQSHADTLEVRLADDTGRWLGKGIGNVNSMLVPYIVGVKFAYRGVYSIEVTQAMREENLKGIIDVGLKIVEHK